MNARIWRNVYGLLMFQKFMGQTIAAMRRYADLSETELGERIGKSAQTIKRLEKNDRETVIKRELEERIVEVTGVTKPIFAEMLAETAGKYLGVRLVVLPQDAPVPSIDVLKAIRLFSSHSYKLDQEERDSIEGLLDDLRCHTAEAERLSKTVAKDVIRRINNARIRLGEDPSDVSED